eukprot:RCo024066
MPPAPSPAEPPAAEFIVETDSDGRVVRRYARGGLLGRGGFARCFLVSEQSSTKIFAAKMVEKSMLVKPQTQAKLRTEIQIHSTLRHKHIVEFERYFEDSRRVYIILELCSGGTLMDLHRRRRQLSEVEIQYFMLQILDAVQYMHRRNVIHRDLKLGNIFLNDQLEVKIGDF